MPHNPIEMKVTFTNGSNIINVSMPADITFTQTAEINTPSLPPRWPHDRHVTANTIFLQIDLADVAQRMAGKCMENTNKRSRLMAGSIYAEVVGISPTPWVAREKRGQGFFSRITKLTKCIFRPRRLDGLKVQVL